MEIAKKRGKYRAVTRSTLGLFLNEECRMKNEEWELHFLLGKREEVKIAPTQLLNEECRMKNEEWELLFLFVKREEGKIALTQWTRWWRGYMEEMDGRCEWSWLYFFDL